MIDYGSVLQNAPIVADPACLEVSLTFPPIDESNLVTPPTEKWRRGAYNYPLSASTVADFSDATWLSQAVRAIRAQAQAVDPRPSAYAIAVASYLIRFASFDDNAPTDERALAYELACGLIEAVAHENGSATRGVRP